MMILPRNPMYLWYFISKSGYFGSITAHNAMGYDVFCLYGAFSDLWPLGTFWNPIKLNFEEIPSSDTDDGFRLQPAVAMDVIDPS